MSAFRRGHNGPGGLARDRPRRRPAGCGPSEPILDAGSCVHYVDRRLYTSEPLEAERTLADQDVETIDGENAALARRAHQIRPGVGIDEVNHAVVPGDVIGVEREAP